MERTPLAAALLLGAGFLAAGMLPGPVLTDPVALAQSSGAMAEGDQNLSFARMLLERRWPIVAEHAIQKGIQSARPSDRDRWTILQTQLAFLQAARALPAGKAEAFKKAISSMEGLLPGEGKKVSGPFASELGELLVENSVLLIEESKREADAARSQEHKKSALKMLEQAEKLFTQRLEEARKETASRPAASGGEDDSEEGGSPASRAERDAAFNLAWVRFQKGMALEAKERETALRQAIREFEDFQATYAQTPDAYRSALLVGQCYSELGDFHRAAQAYVGAASLESLFLNPETHLYEFDNPQAVDIIQRGLYLAAQAYNRERKAAEARRKVERFFKLFPDSGKRPLGLAARLENARAWFILGKYKDAQKAAQGVVDDDPEGSVGAAARDLLTEIFPRLNSGSDGSTDAIVTGLLEKGKIHEAIKVCRQVLSRIDPATPKAAERIAPVLLWLGTAYAQAERHREAAIAFEELFERHPDHKLASKAVFEAITQRLRASSKGGSVKFDQERRERDLKTLLGKYGDSEEAGAAKFLQAQEAMDGGKYVEAETLFLEVPAKAGTYYDNALYQAGLGAYQLAIRAAAKEAKPVFGRAEKRLREALRNAEAEEATLGPARIQNRKKLKLQCHVALADICSSPAIRDYEKGLAEIEAIAKDGEPTGPELGLYHQARARIMANLGRLDDAVQSYKVLRERYPQYRQLPWIAFDLARSFDEAAQKARGESGDADNPSRGDLEKYRQLLTRALEYYAGWLDETKRLKLPVNPRTAAKAADRALAICLEVSGMSEKQESFTDALGRTDLPRESWERAVRLLEEVRSHPARTGAGTGGGGSRPLKPGATTDWAPIAKLGRAHGFAGQYDLARQRIDESLVRGGLLKATNESDPKPKFEVLEKAPDLLDLFIDLAFLDLISGKKAAFTRAQSIFVQSIDKTERESCNWWKCKYGYLRAEFLLGNYEKADAQLIILKAAFSQFDKGACGVQPLFEQLRAELDSKLKPAKKKAAAKETEGAE